jgi:hypothetical protein
MARQRLVEKVYTEYILIGGMLMRRNEVYREVYEGRRASGYTEAEARRSADWFAGYPPALSDEQMGWFCKRTILTLLAHRAGYPLELEDA